MLPFIEIGFISIPTYFLVLCFVFSMTIYFVSVKATRTSFYHKLSMNLCLIAMIAGLIGARGLHVLYENPQYYFKNPWQIFQIWQGGFVFYGGTILAFICCVFYVLKQKQSLGPWLDFFAPIICAGYAFGRLACFFNGCCYGSFCDLPWAIDSRHPTQIYAFLLELFLFFGLTFFIPAVRAPTTQEFSYRWRSYKWSFWKLKYSGQLFFIWLLGHGANRLIMEHFRLDDRGPFVFGLSISSVLSLFFIILGGLGTAGFIRLKELKEKKEKNASLSY